MCREGVDSPQAAELLQQLPHADSHQRCKPCHLVSSAWSPRFPLTAFRRRLAYRGATVADGIGGLLLQEVAQAQLQGLVECLERLRHQLPLFDDTIARFPHACLRPGMRRLPRERAHTAHGARMSAPHALAALCRCHISSPAYMARSVKWRQAEAIERFVLHVIEGHTPRHGARRALPLRRHGL